MLKLKASFWSLDLDVQFFVNTQIISVFFKMVSIKDSISFVHQNDILRIVELNFYKKKTMKKQSSLR